MKWRKISEAEVMMTLENPERIEDTIQGRKNAYRLIGERLLKPKKGDLPQRAQRKVKINQGNKLLFVT